MWDPSSGVSAMHVRDVKPPSAIDTEALYHACASSPSRLALLLLTRLCRYKGQTINAIVDSFRDAGCVRVHILPSLDLITVMLTGIQAPSIKRNEGGAEVAEPFALEAKFFVESRLLNRDVQLLLEGVDKHGNLFGTVIHPAGIISIELVKQGLARTMEWSLKLAKYHAHPSQYHRFCVLNFAIAQIPAAASGRRARGQRRSSSSLERLRRPRVIPRITRLLLP